MGKLRYLIFLLGISLFISAPSYCIAQKFFTEKGKSKLFEEYRESRPGIEKAKKLFIRGIFKKAKKELEKCLEKMPEHHEAHFYLSQIFYKEGDFKKSLAHIEKAESYFMLFEETKAKLMQERLVQIDDKIDALREEILTLEERANEAICQEEVIKGDIENIKFKINSLKAEKISMTPQVSSIPADYYYFHGNCFFIQKRYREAEAQYLEAIKVNPKHSNAYNNLINLYCMSKKFDKANNFLSQAEMNDVHINLKLKEVILSSIKRESQISEK